MSFSIIASTWPSCCLVRRRQPDRSGVRYSTVPVSSSRLKARCTADLDMPSASLMYRTEPGLAPVPRLNGFPLSCCFASSATCASCSAEVRPCAALPRAGAPRRLDVVGRDRFRTAALPPLVAAAAVCFRIRTGLGSCAACEALVEAVGAYRRPEVWAVCEGTSAVDTRAQVYACRY